MSPSGSGLELDFGFGNLLENGNGPSLSDFGTNNGSGNGNGSGNNGISAADFLSLSSLFDSSNVNANANGMSAMPSMSGSTKKTLFDQQQQQDQNSLNALLSQHSAATSNGNGTITCNGNGTSSGNTASFTTREELESLAVNASAAQSNSNIVSNSNSANTNGSNNYMFVATIVDPSQEDATPQQMLFLPGSNQVIPMPSAGGNSATANTSTSFSPMMALANLPVVFPQGTSNTSSEVNTGNSPAPSPWASLQSQQQQQQQQQQSQGILSFNGFSTQTSTLNPLEDAFNQAQAQAQAQTLVPASFDFSSLGFPTSEQVQLQQLPSLTVVKTEPALAPATSSTDANANNKVAMPVRPLSAYNFFFSDERERILHNKTDENDVFDDAKKQRLLLAHLAKDRSKRRPHRKTHGKINFTTLSKLIGQRWKQLPDERKNFYREVAAFDLERYQRELRERSPPNNGGVPGLDAFCA